VRDLPGFLPEHTDNDGIHNWKLHHHYQRNARLQFIGRQEHNDRSVRDIGETVQIPFRKCGVRIQQIEVAPDAISVSGAFLSLQCSHFDASPGDCLDWPDAALALTLWDRSSGRDPASARQLPIPSPCAAGSQAPGRGRSSPLRNIGIRGARNRDRSRKQRDTLRSSR
jgi:hypothetical protein